MCDRWEQFGPMGLGRAKKQKSLNPSSELLEAREGSSSHPFKLTNHELCLIALVLPSRDSTDQVGGGLQERMSWTPKITLPGLLQPPMLVADLDSRTAARIIS
jgi:hypothetical protein